MVSSSFVGYIPCPVCEKETRHYAHNGTSHPRTGTARFIYCDECKVVRRQTYSYTEGWK